MNPKLPAVSGKQVIAALKKRLGTSSESAGGHHVLRHPSIPDAIPVPVHGNRPIKLGTFASILRAAAVGRDKFDRLQ